MRCVSPGRPFALGLPRPRGASRHVNFVPRANAVFNARMDHARMIHPVISSKVVLVEERRAEAAEPSAPIRRYRLARLRLHSRSHDPASRFEHLKRVYD